MQQKSLKEVKNYLRFRNSAGGCYMFFGVLVFLGFFAVMISTLINMDNWDSMGIVAVGTLMFGILMYKSLVSPHIKVAKLAKEWTENGEVDSIIDDFSRAAAGFSPDIVRLGEIYIFGKATGAPVKYTDVRSVCVNQIKTNGMILETDLVAKLLDGKHAVLCKAPRSRNVPQAMHQTLAAIKERNPNVEVIS